MAVIYLRHPIHGAKVATLDMEADFDERNGWERYTPGQVDDDDEPAPVANTLAARTRRRREVADVHHSG
jgi:hypothetical protein